MAILGTEYDRSIFQETSLVYFLSIFLFLSPFFASEDGRRRGGRRQLAPQGDEMHLVVMPTIIGFPANIVGGRNVPYMPI